MIRELLLVAVGLGVGALVIWWLMHRRPHTQDPGPFQLLEQSMANHLHQMAQTMDHRLQENQRAMTESERSVRAVALSLGQLQEATTTLQRTNQEIANFQNMLRHPKIRGSFGEVLLSNLLADVLPRDRYELQYAFRTSREIADAIIRLQDGHIVAIDAKFPLANYEALTHAEDPQTKLQLKKAFLRDVKKHISDIAGKYISAEEKTLDYAFMYIPLEGVYYETMMRIGADTAAVWEFSLKNRVIPTSPNSFLAYLQTILIGLRGMKIEQQAKDILHYLTQIRQDMTIFTKDFAMIGTHLANAKNRYDDSTRRLDRLTNRLENIDQATTPQIDTPRQKDNL